MMTTTAIYEIAPDLFRLSIYVPDFDMQFNHFLLRDEEPLLFHAGLKGMFLALQEAVAKIIDPAKLRHVAWSHFESDEIGALMIGFRLRPKPSPCARSSASS
jgi:flavorubredoxin